VALAAIALVIAGCSGGKDTGHMSTPAKPRYQFQLRFVALQAPATPGHPHLTGAPSRSTPSSSGVIDPDSTKGQNLAQTLAWAASPPVPWEAELQTFRCPTPTPGALDAAGDPDKPMLACDPSGTRYLLSKVVIDGSSLTKSTASDVDGSQDWAVELQLGTKHNAIRNFTKISQALLENQSSGSRPVSLAILIDNQVLAAPTFTGVITNGALEIEGAYTEAAAKRLAAGLIAR
jgi:preprotein translocase subunit SecD